MRREVLGVSTILMADLFANSAQPTVFSRFKIGLSSVKSFVPFGAAFIIVIFLIVIFCLWMSCVRNKDEIYDLLDEIDELEETHSQDEAKIAELCDECARLSTRCGVLEDWKQNVTTIHPKIDQEINEWLAKNIAMRFDKRYSDVVKLAVNKENAKKFQSVFDEYDRVEFFAKKYIKTDMEVIDRKRVESGKILGDFATQKINEVCNRCEGNAGELEELQGIYSYYKNLPVLARLAIPKELINILREKMDMAEDAQEAAVTKKQKAGIISALKKVMPKKS